MGPLGQIEPRSGCRMSVKYPWGLSKLRVHGVVSLVWSVVVREPDPVPGRPWGAWPGPCVPRLMNFQDIEVVTTSTQDRHQGRGRGRGWVLSAETVGFG